MEAYCAARNILLTAYNPLAPLTKLPGGAVDAPVQAAADAHNATAAQVLLRWCLQTGKAVVTTTGKPERLREYTGAFGFSLTEAEVLAISAAGRAQPRRLFWTQCTPMLQADLTLEE